MQDNDRTRFSFLKKNCDKASAVIAAIAQVVSLHARSCSLGNKQEKRRVIVNCMALAWQTWAA